MYSNVQTDILFPQPGRRAGCTRRDISIKKWRKWSAIFGVWTGAFLVPLAVANRDLCVLTIVTWKSFGSRSKNRPNYEPSALADPGRSTRSFCWQRQKPRCLWDIQKRMKPLNFHLLLNIRHIETRYEEERYIHYMWLSSFFLPITFVHENVKEKHIHPSCKRSNNGVSLL